MTAIFQNEDLLTEHALQHKNFVAVWMGAMLPRMTTVNLARLFFLYLSEGLVKTHVFGKFKVFLHRSRAPALSVALASGASMSSANGPWPTAPFR